MDQQINESARPGRSPILPLAAQGKAERATDVAHFVVAKLRHPPPDAGLLDGQHVVQVDGARLFQSFVRTHEDLGRHVTDGGRNRSDGYAREIVNRRIALEPVRWGFSAAPGVSPPPASSERG